MIHLITYCFRLFIYILLTLLEFIYYISIKKNMMNINKLKIKEYKNFLRVVDLKQKNLIFAKKFILKNKITLIKNFALKNSFKDYIKLAKSFGKTLDYNNKPYYKFDESSQQPISLHTDGVSCLNYKKIPSYILFYVDSWPKNKKGFFKVSSTKKIIQMLPKKYVQILKNHKLQYLNYAGTHKRFVKINNEDEVTFKKFCLRKVNGHWTLDMFLPIKKMTKDVKWDYKMQFEGLSLKDSEKILKNISKITDKKECKCEFPLSSKSLLIVNNERFFHGRNKFSEKVKRSLYRIQVLN